MTSTREILFQDDKMTMTAMTGEFADPDRAIADLQAKGCGAWRGDRGCNRPVDPKALILGEWWLNFHAYRSLFVPGFAHIVVTCKRHEGSRLVRDMEPALRRSQEAEYRRFKALQRAHE